MRPYLDRARFVVRSDQESLSWVFCSASVDNARLARFRLKVVGFDFSVKHDAGVKNRVADCLSRNPTDGAVRADGGEFEEIPCLIVDKLSAMPGPMLLDHEWDPNKLDDFREAQARDEDSQRILNQQLVWTDYDEEGILVRVSPRDGAVQRVVPAELRERLLTLAHYPKVAGHPGRDKLFATIRREYFWPGMSMDCSRLVQQCPSCARKRLKGQRRVSKMNLFPPSNPLEFVALDLLGPLPVTRQVNRFLLVIGDRYIKDAQTVPLKTVMASECAHAFFSHWMAKYGAPLLVLSENGSQFASRFFQAVCATLGVKQIFTSEYHPQSMAK